VTAPDTPTGHSTRRYRIICDAGIRRATITIHAAAASGAASTAHRVTVRGNAKAATINAIVNVLRKDYLMDRRQEAAIRRMVAARLSRAREVSLASGEIAAALLKAAIAPPADHWAARYSVPRSTGDGTWTVAQAKNGAWGCSCPRWKFKREHCKHIQEVQAHPHWYPYLQQESYT
jgi:hypothetical protein